MQQKNSQPAWPLQESLAFCDGLAAKAAKTLADTGCWLAAIEIDMGPLVAEN
jgi:hypothetical protein